MLQIILRTQLGTLRHVQIRQPGQALLTRNFKIKPDATVWGWQTETKIDRRELHHSRNSLDHQTVDDMLRRFRDEQTRRSLQWDCAAVVGGSATSIKCGHQGVEYLAI